MRESVFAPIHHYFFYTCICQQTGDAVAAKKAEQELFRKQEKENQEPTPKRRKENLATKTPCRKSNATKKRKAL